MEVDKDIEECEYCHRYFAINTLRRLPIFFGWCYELICKECYEEPPVKFCDMFKRKS